MRTKPESIPRGSSRKNAILNDWQVIGIMARLLQGVPRPQAAREFGVSRQLVGRIERGLIWTHLFEAG